MTDLQEFKDQLRSIGVFCGDRSSVVESMPKIEVKCTMEATRAQEIGRNACEAAMEEDKEQAAIGNMFLEPALAAEHQGRLKLESTHLLHRHEVSYENLVCMQVHTACAGPCIGNVSWCCGRRACPFLWW